MADRTQADRYTRRLIHGGGRGGGGKEEEEEVVVVVDMVEVKEKKK